MTHEIHFALHVANREAMDFDFKAPLVPWVLDLSMVTVPRCGEFLWIPHEQESDPAIRARCGTPEHLYDYPSRTIRIKLHLDRLSADDADSIGVKHEPWMNG